MYKSNPSYKLEAFNCPFCQVYAQMIWVRAFAPQWTTNIDLARCSSCKKDSIWSYNEEQLLYPKKINAPHPHVDMPDDCKVDYVEAREISAHSVRGAAALLRLCLQRLMPHLNAEGKNINENIAYLVKEGLADEMQQALDYVRVIGNEAVHPGELSLEDAPETVNALFDLINFIVEDLISRPKKIKGMFASLPKGAKDSVIKRDRK